MTFLPEKFSEIIFNDETGVLTLFEGEKTVRKYDGNDKDLILKWIAAPGIRDGWTSENIEIWRKVV